MNILGNLKQQRKRIAEQLQDAFLSYVKIDVENNTYFYRINTEDIEFGNKLESICKYIFNRYFQIYDKEIAENFMKFMCILVEHSLLEIRKYPEYRLGQAIFNESDRLLHHNLAGSKNDCFYDDNKIIDFLKDLEKIINETKS